jgi:hypothetical protein
MRCILSWSFFRSRYLFWYLILNLCSGLVSQAQENSQKKSAEDVRAEEIFRTNNNITIIQLEALKENNQPKTALKLLDYELNRDPQNHELWAYLGLNYVEQKNYMKAKEAYKKAVENSRSPQADLYLYNLAEAENLNGNTEDAKKYLNQIPEGSAYKSSAQNALMNMKSGQKLADAKLDIPGNFKVNLGLKTGYDDNVLLFSENTLATAQRTDTASAYLNPELNIAYSKPVSYGLFHSSLNLNSQLYQNEKAKPYQSFAGVLSAGVSAQKPAWANLTHSLTNTFKSSYLDTSNTFNHQSWDDTLQWKGIQNFSEASNLTYGFAVRYQKYPEGAGLDNRTGVALKPEVTYSTSRGDYSGSIGANYERLAAEGDNYKSDTLGVPLSVDKKINESINANLGFTYTYTQYPDSSTNRKDGTGNLNASFNKQFNKKLSSGLGYTYTKNASSESSATYTRQTIDLKVNYEID